MPTPRPFPGGVPRRYRAEVDLTVTAVDRLEPQALGLVRLRGEELHARYGGHGPTPPSERYPDGADHARAGEVPHLDGDVADVSTPGVVLLGRDRSAGTAVAFANLRHVTDGVAEVRCLYVAPPFRGIGISRTLLTEVEREAAALGWAVVRVRVDARQPHATRFYREAGYRPTPPSPLLLEKDVRHR